MAFYIVIDIAKNTQLICSKMPILIKIDSYYLNWMVLCNLLFWNRKLVKKGWKKGIFSNFSIFRIQKIAWWQVVWYLSKIPESIYLKSNSKRLYGRHLGMFMPIFRGSSFVVLSFTHLIQKIANFGFNGFLYSYRYSMKKQFYFFLKCLSL